MRFLLVLALITPVAAFASGGHGDDHGEKKEKTKEEKRAENKEYVKHHTNDSHDFGLFTIEGEKGEEDSHVGFPLPVILWEDGLHIFMSSKFHHGHEVVESNGKYFVLDYHDGKIYNADEHGNILKKEVDGEEVKLAPLDFSITKNVLVTILMAVLLFFLFRGIAKSYKTGLAPTGAAKFFEPIIVFIRDEIAIPNIGEGSHKKYMPYLLTVFFFIWFLNLAGMTPLGINVTGNIAVTCALAIMTFVITNATAKKNYWLHIFWMPGVPIPMKILLMPIEIIGVFVKPFALMIRLYANMLAGHIVLGSLIAVVFFFDAFLAKTAFVGLTFFLNIIELLVALLQAYIFTMLTALYFGAAAEEAHH
ncbi:MAG: F0F1 ATP synthase subunit A [bacterium]|nr:F0F1 ATP synthase subunit A [bacterium]